MLNISENSVRNRIDLQGYEAPVEVKHKKRTIGIARLLLILLAVLFFISLLPWTQTVPGDGKVTSLRPEQRPQAVQSVIAGRIEKWYVGEGDRVTKGDTLLFISETKDQYFDPLLLVRTQEQIDAKVAAVEAYKDKVSALDQQIAGLEEGRKLKLDQIKNKIIQAELKVRTDSTDFEAAVTQANIADDQYKRAENLINQGLYSQTDLEIRRLKQREAEAKEFSAQNKLLEARNELINATINLNSTAVDFDMKIAKARAERFTTLSLVRDAEISVSKLRNQYASYAIRRGFYYVTAPQSGYITQATRTGIGETVKEGQDIVTIMPEQYDLAVEIYIQPRDLPLVEVGSEVRLIFDGWPAFIFSGWPMVSTGTFGGRVVAIDRFTNGVEGKYRLLIAPDPDKEKEMQWPEALRPGSGVQGMVLLGDVSVAYEVWRRLNGFPPAFYEAQNGAGGMGKNDKGKEGGK